MPCFSDDAPAACGKSYEENDSEMINLDGYKHQYASSGTKYS